MDKLDILIIDDDRSIREILTQVLQDQNYVVTSADNGATALEMLQTSGVQPRLILLDLAMPVMPGWIFRRRQLEDSQLSAIPVVLISGAADVYSHAHDLRIAEFVVKPLNLDHVLDAVARYC